MCTFLIVNVYSKSWKYIPMGTFGICDFLRNHNIESKIFNASLYNSDEYLNILKNIIYKNKPLYVGIIIQWKELLEESIFIAHEIKKISPDIKIIAGGITASYFSEEIINRYKCIDYVIKGDPEKILYSVINNQNTDEIPNLVYRKGERSFSNKIEYFIESEALNKISFSNLSYLIDWELYIKEINEILGFPIFIGTGCPNKCLYCGGSNKAFQEHSGRNHFIFRSIKAIIRDLKLLINYTDYIYIGYEVSREFNKGLFKAIASEKEIKKKFLLNYGAWQLVDIDFLNLYSNAFKTSSKRKTIIEISPETSVNKDRKIIKDRSLFFSNQQLLECIKQINTILDQKTITIRIFFSRYHKTHKNKEKLLMELNNIHSFRESLFHSGFDNVDVLYSHLATDPGSDYWDCVAKKNSKLNMIDVLFMNIKKNNLLSANNYKKSNICIYIPQNLSSSTTFIYEQILFCINTLIADVPYYYFLICKLLSFKNFISIINSVVSYYFHTEKWYFFNDLKSEQLIDLIQKNIKDQFPSIYKLNPMLFDDIRNIFIRFLYSNLLNTSYRNKIKYSQKPILNKNRFYIGFYNLLSKKIYLSLNGNIAHLKQQKTLYIFTEKISCFPYKHYRLFELFDGKKTFSNIIKVIVSDDLLKRNECFELINFLNTNYYEITL